MAERIENQGRLGVMVMAYGTPGSLAEVEPYYTHIRRGRPPSPEQLADLVGRYERVGGAFPLRDITFAQARLIEEALNANGADAKVFVGMKHWHPYVAETVREMAAAGIQRAVGVVLAPHYSKIGVGQYFEYAEKEREASAPSMPIKYVERWGNSPYLIDALTQRVRTCLEGFNAEKTMVLFTAHSLPQRIRTWDDPYERELMETATLTANRLALPHWQFAFQSASSTGEPWIGPDILEVIPNIAADGKFEAIVACPVGFVADHLEILYDLDIEVAEACARVGLAFRRTPSLNTDPLLVRAVSDAVLRTL
jgi:ferrochelatase